MQHAQNQFFVIAGLASVLGSNQDVYEKVKSDASTLFSELEIALIGDDGLYETENYTLDEVDLLAFSKVMTALGRVSEQYAPLIEDITTSRAWTSATTSGELVAALEVLLSDPNIDRPALDNSFPAFAEVDASDITEIALLVKKNRGTAEEALSAYRKGELFDFAQKISA